jgi:hypothetical protein
MAVNEEKFHHFTEEAVQEYLKHLRHPSNRKTDPFILE